MTLSSSNAPSFVTVFLFQKGSVSALNDYLINYYYFLNYTSNNINRIIVKLKSHIENCADSSSNLEDSTLVR